MAKFVKTSPSGKIEICIKKTNYEKNQDYIRKYPQSRFIKEYVPEPWVKVVFNDGANFDHEWIRQELQKAATGPNNHRECVLQIFNYRITNDAAILFIKLTDIGYSSFKSNCNKIPHPHSGHPCDVVVMSIENPETPSNLPDKWINCLKDSLSFRYNSTTKSLNLSNFTEDNHMNNQGLWMSLSRPAVVKAIVNLLQSIDNFVLNELDLSNNNLTFSTHLIPLFETVPIHNLTLSDNSLIQKALFRTLQFANYLVTLTIRNDKGMCGQKMKYHQSFVSELTENCPSLDKFNDEDLKTDRFGVPARLPVSKKSSSDTDQLLLNFFSEHALKIETNRDDLIDYYSSDSVLTLSACYHDMSLNNRRLSEVYLRNSRNLERLKDSTRRHQLVKRGSAQILGLMSEMPKLRHIPDSFCVDSIVNDEQSKMFVVNGLFVECIKVHNHQNSQTQYHYRNGGTGSWPGLSNGYSNGNADKTVAGSATMMVVSDDNGATTNTDPGTHHVYNVRMFSRTMIVVAPGKILQENWTITNATDFLFRKYRERFEEIRSSVDSEKNSSLARPDDSSKTSHNVTAANDSSTALIVDNFCQFSNMNKFYSQQCLQESNWDVDKAKEIFQLAFNNGKIPSEAFIK